MKNRIIKHETSKIKFRVFKNRFSSYVLQKKEKNSSNKEWKVVNAFAKEDVALKFLESEVKKELRNDLRFQISHN